jgi:choline dehydrogenase
MLSGVGPAAHLAEHKIPVITALPGVGEHLMDHPVVDVALAETTGTTLNFLKPTTIWHRVQRLTALLTYYLTGKGPLTSNVTCPCSTSLLFRFQQSGLVDRGSGCVLPFR